MKPPIDTIRLTNSGRDKLIQLKRITGIEHWNTLCRWALCVAISARLEPTGKEAVERCNVEMSWSTFSGVWSDVLAGITYLGWRSVRGRVDGLTVAEYFNSMLDLGIAMLHKAVAEKEQPNVETLVSIASNGNIKS